MTSQSMVAPKAEATCNEGLDDSTRSAGHVALIKATNTKTQRREHDKCNLALRRRHLNLRHFDPWPALHFIGSFRRAVKHGYGFAGKAAHGLRHCLAESVIDHAFVDSGHVHRVRCRDIRARDLQETDNVLIEKL
eukprot:CAMPEP_0115185288 /NCGR_PEP_ID=MMETSP0270-20121206/9395_1 /TAXON_ID=71861 /ORGANISM="Scrippsiella trochoidea, Strain CCMP3099" /LENGTH=134 /DNA_ID=CAMNT_0002598389 /DNA_START=199 /DNA_END=602 /DNA_ORIENTATION=-